MQLFTLSGDYRADAGNISSLIRFAQWFGLEVNSVDAAHLSAYCNGGADELVMAWIDSLCREACAVLNRERITTELMWSDGLSLVVLDAVGANHE